MTRVVQFGILLLLLAAHLRGEAQNDFEWKDGSGKARSLSDLVEILRKHETWLESDQKSGIQADLRDVDLSRANVTGVNLTRANLYKANLSDAKLSRTNLSEANLNDADLTDAELNEANLNAADLINANLRRANLTRARLSRAKLSGADLQSANLVRSDLREADLSGASVLEAKLDGAVFEPKSLPELRGIAGARGLEMLRYDSNPDALVQLRKQFEDGGFREQERKITYALKRRETELSCDRCIRMLPTDCLSFVFNTVFFDWTCRYGMSPGRPLILGLLLWLLCSLLYFGFIHTSGHAGLYRVHIPSVGKDPSNGPLVARILPRKITHRPGPRWLIQFFWRECLLLGTAMFFSLMSAFNIGFRDINFGRWLRLLTRQEFDIKAVGWARVVAGWQSLISVYLVALWVLTYFGRPFG